MNLKFRYEDNTYAMHAAEYSAIWSAEGRKIEKGFKRILGFSFTERNIDVLICSGDDNGGNSSGKSIRDPMIFRHDNRCKIGTILHELSHRIVLERGWYPCTDSGIGDIHELIDLFLFDLVSSLYGENAASKRVAYECSFPEIQYSASWKFALSMDAEARRRKFLECIKRA